MDRVLSVTKDCFNALRMLQRIRPEQAVVAGDLYQRLRAEVDEMCQTAVKGTHRFKPEEVELIKYAVVALIDEVALSKQGSIFEHWNQNPLQVHYFGSNRAGTQFFENLNVVMTKTDVSQLDILRVYSLCLLFGFRGRYAHEPEGERKLQAIQRGINARLGRYLREQNLSPHARRPKERRRSPWLIPAGWITMVFLLFTVGLLVDLHCALSNQTETLVEQVEDLLRVSPAG